MWCLVVSVMTQMMSEARHSDTIVPVLVGALTTTLLLRITTALLLLQVMSEARHSYTIVPVLVGSLTPEREKFYGAIFARSAQLPLPASLGRVAQA